MNDICVTYFGILEIGANGVTSITVKGNTVKDARGSKGIGEPTELFFVRRSIAET